MHGLSLKIILYKQKIKYAKKSNTAIIIVYILINFILFIVCISFVSLKINWFVSFCSLSSIFKLEISDFSFSSLFFNNFFLIKKGIKARKSEIFDAYNNNIL